MFGALSYGRKGGRVRKWLCRGARVVIWAYTTTATAMKTWKTNGVLLRNRQIHDIVGQISPSYVLGRHDLRPPWSLFVAVIVEPRVDFTPVVLLFDVNRSFVSR